MWMMTAGPHILFPLALVLGVLVLSFVLARNAHKKFIAMQSSTG